jgi:hypothetical protein
MEAYLGDPGLAGVLEAARVSRRGGAIFVVVVDRGDGGIAVGERDDRAALVGVEIGAVRDCGAFVADQGLAARVNIAPLEDVRSVPFGDQVGPVIGEARDR